MKLPINNEPLATDKQEEQVLRGIQPRHQTMYYAYRTCKIFSILILFLAILFFILSFVKKIQFITGKSWFRYFDVILFIIAAFLLFLMKVIKAIFLRRAPFDDWVYEIAEKRLGTSIIFYDSKYIYINYDRGGKEVDKKEFVTEMSDKSIHFSYFYVRTDIDQGYIVVQCKKRAPIPNIAIFSQEDDKYWNILPLGLTIHPTKQKIAPVGWYLNDQNINEELLDTVPSTSILIAGGTGCFAKGTPILIYNSLIK